MRALLLLFLVGCGGAPDNPLAEAGTDASTGGDATVMDGTRPDGAVTDGGFSPKNVACLVLWLDAARGVSVNGGLVTAWADQTSFKNDATQGIPLRQPKPNPGAINNLPGVEFKSNVGTAQGNMLVIADSASLQWGTGDFLVAAVARFDNDPKDGLVAGAAVLYSRFKFNMSVYTGAILVGNVPGTIYQPGLALQGASMRQGSAPGPYNDGKFRLYTRRRNGLQLELRVNAASVATMSSPSTDVSSTGSVSTIGAEADANVLRLNGTIAELLACKGPIDPNDLTAIEKYLMTKYGL